MPSSASRSRTRSRSRSGSGSRDSRRGRSRSRRHSGSRDSMRRDRSRSRRVRSRYRDHGTTHHPHSSQYVPAPVARHDVEESSVSSGDEDKLEGTEKGLSREKKIKKVDIANPLSTFKKQNRQRKQHFTPSAFVKEKWLYLRGMNGDGKFVTEDVAKTDTWKHVAKSDRLLKKYAGDVFADT